MKKYFKSALFASLLTIVLSFTACQTEDPPVVETSEEETMTANSAAASLMTNMVSNDGSYDNIVDGSSCFDIRFPYTVSVNGLDITINSKDDLRLIEEIFDALDEDNDILDIIFPVTITLADYSEITIENLAQLREHSEECIEGGDDDDIECIDVIYPVTFFTYDREAQQTGSVNVGSDKEMRRFFAGLDMEDIISLQFPVMFEMYDGTKVMVESIGQLRETIERAKESCDEDDDDDHNDDDFTKERLDNLLVECPWLVKEVKREYEYSSDQYENYIMNFNEDGSVTVKDHEGNLLNGEWTTRVSEYRVLLRLEFEFLADFTLEWFVYDIDGDRIKLHAGDGDKITLKTTCGEEPEVCNAEFIEETISTCRWVVDNAESGFLEDLNIDFSNRNIHVWDASGSIQDEGNWSIEGQVMVFNDLSMTFANYIGEWTVVECAPDRFKIKRGDDEYLILEKECE
jgi:hypothetical protein